MYIGNFPEKNFRNNTLTARGDQIPGHSMYHDVRFRLTEVRGDWKHHQQVWGLVRAAFTSNNICHLCEASRTEERYTMLEFTASPAWASTIRSHQKFLSDIMAPHGCGLIYCKGFHYTIIRWCSMHSVQLGAGLFLNGGCFFELMKISWWGGGSAATCYRAAYRSFKKFLTDHKIQCSQPIFKPYMYVSTGEESCTFRSKEPCSKWFLFFFRGPCF